ncbi:MAG: pentapeptide repeat-containing protein [Deltaproteobacteria bacterium]|nr:pentapeptide repeat-containing protein [Deltaproteobacteria bacterium]
MADAVQERARLDEAISHVGLHYLTLQAFGAYVAVSAASVTHEALLGSSQSVYFELPLLSAKVSPIGFGCVAPLLLFALHLDVLIHMCLLSWRKQSSREAYRLRMFPSVLAVAVMGTNGHAIPTPTVLRAVAWITTVITTLVLPNLVLLWVWYQFLAYHGPWLTPWQLACVAIDTVAVVLTWPLIRDPEYRWLGCRPPWLRLSGRGVPRFSAWAGQICRFLTWGLALVTVAACFLLIFVAWSKPFVIDGFLDRHLIRRNLQLSGMRLVRQPPASEIVAVYVKEFGPRVDGDAASRAAWRDHAVGLELQGRDLQSADLAHAWLPRADLRKTQLQGAVFYGSNLDRALLTEAQLEGAPLQWASLIGAHLGDAQLEGADLSDADLANADLRGARLEGADLSRVNLRGANLKKAHLEGANLSYAALDGADLRLAHLQAADLSYASLHGALLAGAHLEGVRLLFAQADGWNLRYAFVWKADFGEVAVDLSAANQSPMSADAVAELIDRVGRMVPDGRLRSVALDRLKRLETLH